MFRFWLGAYSLPIEMGWRQCVARVARVCPLRLGMQVGDVGTGGVFDCCWYVNVCICHSSLVGDLLIPVLLVVIEHDVFSGA